MFYTYCLENKRRHFLYIGSTNDLKRRTLEHSRGKVQSTKAYLPLTLTAYVAVQTEQQSRKLEKYFKTGSGKAILKKRILSNEAPA
ncbi:MAG: GIY-YIG nuclease family protein [Candidatus Neomarinimicrobiota bacterium]